jgi:cold-inducible RNA-binding protein
MSTKLFVGSLSWDVTDAQLKELFETIGEVVSANVIMDRNSGRSKGFGFVEMSTAELAAEAVKQLNDKELDGRTINVSIAKPREERPAGGSYRGGQQGGNRNNYSNRY